MKTIAFDSGPVISFALNNLLWIFPKLLENYNGKFVIPPKVKYEIVERPLTIRRFKFEAFQVLELVNDDVLTLTKHDKLESLTDEILDAANSMFLVKSHPITIVHRGEAEVIALAILLKSDAIVVDERTTRLLIEAPKSLLNILGNKLHTQVTLNDKVGRKLEKTIGKIQVIRSVELLTVAYELGLLNRYTEDIKDMKNASQEMLGASLWSLKYKGATVSEKEIEKILKIERTR